MHKSFAPILWGVLATAALACRGPSTADSERESKSRPESGAQTREDSPRGDADVTQRDPASDGGTNPTLERGRDAGDVRDVSVRDVSVRDVGGGRDVSGRDVVGRDSGGELRRVDFEGTSPGVYAQEQVLVDFGSAASWNNGLDEGRAAIVEESSNRFLRVHYAAKQFGPAAGGVQFQVALGQSYDELYLSYRVRFASGFEFVKGGKLPGLVGGSAPTGCVSDPTGFSARLMWRTGGAVVQYMYFPEKKNACGDDYDYSFGGTALRFAPGTWHTVQNHLVMNAPGAHDGVLQAWFDGQLALDDHAFLFRAAGATFAIDALYFSTFFGGSDATWAPSSEQTADFDEFVFSSSPTVSPR